jgi:hypothetical protein
MLTSGGGRFRTASNSPRAVRPSFRCPSQGSLNQPTLPPGLKRSTVERRPCNRLWRYVLRSWLQFGWQHPLFFFALIHVHVSLSLTRSLSHTHSFPCTWSCALSRSCILYLGVAPSVVSGPHPLISAGKCARVTACCSGWCFVGVLVVGGELGESRFFLGTSDC